MRDIGCDLTSDAYTDIEDVSIHTLYTVLFACERVRVGYVIVSD